MRIKHFIYTMALSLSLPVVSCTTAGSGSEQAQPPKKEVSIQLYSVRDLLKDNSKLEEVLKQLADMGYTSVETANYNDGKFYGKTPQEFKQLVESVGMKVLSAHSSRALSDKELASGDFSESLKWWDQCIADHKAAGMKYIVTPAFPMPNTIKGLQTYCDYFNEIGKKCKEAGLQYGYHNHSHEFQKLEDKEVAYDYMLQHTNPEYVFFEMDVYWVVRGQNSPVDYFKKYPGRFKVLHKRSGLSKLNLTYVLKLRLRGKLCGSKTSVLKKSFSYSMVFWGIAAPFSKQGVVIVACYGGLIFFIAVCACVKTEIGAAVEHIKTEVSVGVEHVFELRNNSFVRAGVMLFAPVVKPAVPEFSTHKGSVRLNFFKYFKCAS